MRIVIAPRPGARPSPVLRERDNCRPARKTECPMTQRSRYDPARLRCYRIGKTFSPMNESNPSAEMRNWMCLICGWIYDEAAGLPDEGIAPGTRWEDVPPNWTCPECGARKEDFEMVEI
jgi:rubredoxin